MHAPLFCTFISSSGSLSATGPLGQDARGFEPLTLGFSVFCSEQLIPHPLPLFPSVSFLHRQSVLPASSGLSPSSSRTESLKGPVPAGLAGPLPIGRVGSSSLPTPRCISRKRLSAPGTPGGRCCPPGDSTKRFFLSRNFARPFHFLRLPNH